MPATDASYTEDRGRAHGALLRGNAGFADGGGGPGLAGLPHGCSGSERGTSGAEVGARFGARADLPRHDDHPGSRTDFRPARSGIPGGSMLPCARPARRREPAVLGADARSRPLAALGERDGLAGVVCRLKSASARSTNAALGRSGAVWARAFHDHALRCDEDLLALARYIVANPVRAGLVRRVGDYPFWNAIWL